MCVRGDYSACSSRRVSVRNPCECVCVCVNSPPFAGGESQSESEREDSAAFVCAAETGWIWWGMGVGGDRSGGRTRIGHKNSL